MDFINTSILTVIGLVVTAFAATNLDNMLILVVLLGANAQRRSAVLLGFVFSALAVLSVSAIGVALGSLVNPGFIGYLGVIPLSMGLYMLVKTSRGQLLNDPDIPQPGKQSEPGVWLSTFVLMFSNSGDSVAVFLPLLAESGRTAMVTILCTYVLLIAVWGSIAYLISGQKELAVRIERKAEKLVPWIMMGVGTYILLNTATDTLV